LRTPRDGTIRRCDSSRSFSALVSCNGEGATATSTPHGGASGTDRIVDAPSSTPIVPVTSDAVYVVNGGSSSISVVDAARSVAQRYVHANATDLREAIAKLMATSGKRGAVVL
jgi:hypothetical protein